MMSHMPCYGNLFPSVTFRQAGKERSGSVFGYEFRQAGTAALPPEIIVDLAAWDQCVACRDFQTCQQLSAAKLLLETAVRTT